MKLLRAAKAAPAHEGRTISSSPDTTTKSGTILSPCSTTWQYVAWFVEDLLEKLKRNRDELSSVEVKILVEMYQMLEKALDIDRRHLEEYLRKRLKNGDGYLVR